MRVLVVEDEKRLASALAHILNEQKYMVDIANNGNDGYYMASNESYDIIVLDVMLPGKDGFEILRALRKNKNN
ncbi:MAG: response regulator, partial [Clostridia bacterium]|nr:response regulator [Clostridia bacterium]